jgi:chloramphenicol O-acetyltransferase type A
MKNIDIYNWKRKKYFKFYKGYSHPHFSVNVNIDITMLINYIKNNNHKFFPTFIYVLMKALNKIDEFKYRIRNDQVVLHNLVHPSFTVLNEQEQYVFCHTEFIDDFYKYTERVKDSIKIAMKGSNLEDEENRDDLVFVSSLPWISYSAITHPIDTEHPDSFPRIVFGKYYQDNQSYKLPFSVSAHHGLCDGLHVAKLIAGINEEISVLIKN